MVPGNTRPSASRTRRGSAPAPAPAVVSEGAGAGGAGELGGRRMRMARLRPSLGVGVRLPAGVVGAGRPRMGVLGLVRRGGGGGPGPGPGAGPLRGGPLVGGAGSQARGARGG